MQSPDRHFRCPYTTSMDSGDDHLTNFVLPRPAYNPNEQVYKRNLACFSFDQGHGHGAPIVQDGYYEQQARQFRNENNQRPSVIGRDPINQPRQQYGGELSAANYEILDQKPNDSDSAHAQNFSVPYDEFLPNLMRNTESFRPTTQQPYDFNDAPYSNTLMPAQQSEYFKSSQDHGNGLGEPMQEFQLQHNHVNEEQAWAMQKEPRLELRDPSEMGYVGESNICNSGSVTKVTKVDRWNDGYDSEAKKNAAVMSTAASDWARTPSQMELTSMTTMDHSWDSINSAFYHHQVVEFSPSTDSFASEISECVDKWMPFGDGVLRQPPLESLAIGIETVSKDNCDVMCSEKDD